MIRGLATKTRAERTIFLNKNIAKSDQGIEPGIWGIVMKRFAVFALLGPPIAGAAFYLILLPLAGMLEGVPVVISTPVLPAWSYAVFAALVVAVFDWVASLIEVPFGCCRDRRMGIGLRPSSRVSRAAGLAGMVRGRRHAGRDPGVCVFVGGDEDGEAGGTDWQSVTGEIGGMRLRLIRPTV